MISHRQFTLQALALAAALTASSAYAVDFDGYFRAGPGTTNNGHARACYDLGIIGGHYRLGNECDFYGEFGLSRPATWMAFRTKPRSCSMSTAPAPTSARRARASSRCISKARVSTSRPERTSGSVSVSTAVPDVHILDKFFVNMSGVGAGGDSIALGGGTKLGVAYFSGDSSGGLGDGGTRFSTTPGNRLNVDVTDIPVNPGGKLRVTGTFTKGHYDNATDGKGTTGAGISLEHKQELNGLGGANTAWLQYAQGSAGLDANFGTKGANSSYKQWLAVESLTWQVGPFRRPGGGAVRPARQGRGHNVAKYNEMSVGGRGSFAITKNFKLVGELGYMEKKPDGSATQKLTKFTFAPTLSTGPGFFNRPELRLYVTAAKWNDAANAAAGSGGLTGFGDGKTKGTSFGAQAEIWF